jgi:hypothetical protein
MPSAIALSSSGGLVVRENDIAAIELGEVSDRPGIGTRTSL